MRSLLIVLTAAAAFAEAPAVRHRLPALTSVFPQGAEPGTRLRAEVLGEYLDRAADVIFLSNAIRGRVLKSEPTRMALEFDVARDAAYGPHYFRVVSPRGASNILLFRVGDQPHRAEREPNSTFDQAEEVPVPVTINARLDGDGDFDFFRFRAGAGQTWVFDLRSARNGNGLDAALILLDEAGRKLEHDEDHFIWDPFFTHTFQRTGWYVIAVQPTHRFNDPNFAYQLDVRTAPYLQTVAPLSVAPGAAVEATVYGKGLIGPVAKLWFSSPGFEGEVLDLRGDSARIRMRVPADAGQGVHELALVNAGGRSNRAKFLVDATPVHHGGGRIAPPVSITGTAHYRQPERFKFQAQAGQKLAFEVRAQRFGSPVDSVLRILDPQGKPVAVNDDGQFAGVRFNKDSYLLHTFKEAGEYTLEMRNLWQVTGENFPYELVVRPPKPAVELMLATDQPRVEAGGEGSLKVTAVRKDGFVGPVRIEVKGCPAGVSAEAAEIPAGKNEGEIKFRAKDVRPGTHGEIQVVSAQAAAPAWRAVRISSGGGEGATFARVDRATLAVAEGPRLSLEAGLNTVNLVRGGSAEVPVNITRAAAFDSPVRFELHNLPPGVRAEPAVAGPADKSVKIVLRADQNAATGRSPRVAILGFTDSGLMEEAPRIAVVVD